MNNVTRNITLQDVIEIRHLHTTRGMMADELALLFSVDASVVQSVIDAVEGKGATISTVYNAETAIPLYAQSHE